MVISLILVLASVTLLELLWRESLSAYAGEKAAAAQQLADAAGEMVVGWFHSPRTVPAGLVDILKKRLVMVDGTPTYFDQEGRSQFSGTMDHPDALLDAENPLDDQLLHDPDAGTFRPMLGSGKVRMLKIYAPSRPGSLCTVEVTVETRHHTPFSQSIRMELQAIELPPLRAGMQSKNDLKFVSDGHVVGGVHWGPVVVGKDLIIRRIEDIPDLNPTAPITGQSYDESSVREDRWMQMWIGERVVTTEPLPDPPENQPLPIHVHAQQNPSPGIQLDQWTYDELKRTALRFGSYYGIDHEGFLYEDGLVESGRKLMPEDVFGSLQVGDQRGLIFVDTLDQSAPRADNLGTVKLGVGYFEGVAVIQGHVLFAPTSSGHQLNVQGPSTADGENIAVRKTIPLTGIHLNGVLYAVGDLTVNRGARVFGTVIAEGTIRSADAGATLEIWHDQDMNQGLYRGIPLVFRAPGTWSARY